MKTNASQFLPAAVLAAICALFALAGCASLDASNQESMLIAAGFKARTPETPKQQQLYAAAPAYKVQHAMLNGKSFYAYKDEKKGLAYVGGDAAYQQYQQLAIQQQIAQENYQAAEMNHEMAMGWYGEYGPYVFGAPIVLRR